MDRIDIHIEVTPVSYSELREERSGETSEEIRKRVNKARDIQRKRFEMEKQVVLDFDQSPIDSSQSSVGSIPIDKPRGEQAGAVASRPLRTPISVPITSANADMTSKQIRKYCQLDSACAEILKKAMEKYGFSARAYDRILKVARTIADLDGVQDIGTRHIAEAVQYRSLDRKEWGG